MDISGQAAGYIANDTKAFKTFVAKRVHVMQENSNVN